MNEYVQFEIKFEISICMRCISKNNGVLILKFFKEFFLLQSSIIISLRGAGSISRAKHLLLFVFTLKDQKSYISHGTSFSSYRLTSFKTFSFTFEIYNNA